MNIVKLLLLVENSPALCYFVPLKAKNEKF
jgi:hypothetical protein